MPGIRKRGEEIRDFIVKNIAESKNIAVLTSEQFGISLPAVYKHFDKTIVPVRLANTSDLVSRSQARRILSGLELFREVILDFKDVEYIGQAFADEIFRVFKKMNPNTLITAQNANAETQYMINRAVNTVI